jgi:hypothetical protein
MKQMGGWVYMMCSLNHSTLYVGVTSNIASEFLSIKINSIPQALVQDIIV